MQPPRGTRDFGPAEMAQRRALEARMRDVFRAYNYREVQTPTFEELELFLAKSGPGIREELYEFKDKSDRELALRPELTAPVMRFYFSAMKMDPKPVRVFYFGPCYRYDRPQAGRYREFWQMGCELIGDETPEAHAELLRLVIDLFAAAGLKDVRLRIGHLGILRAILSRFGIARENQPPLMRLIDKKDLPALREALRQTMPAPQIEAFLSLFPLADRTWNDEDLFGPKAAIKESAFWKGLLDDPAGQSALAHLTRVLQAAGTFGVKASMVSVDPMIARGLDYYTGLVFELDAPFLGAEKQLLGGGSYDLAEVFKQPPVPCVGFALGFDRTLVAMEKSGAALGALERPDAYCAALDANAYASVANAAFALRARGLRIELESAPVSLKRALQRANQVGAAHVVFAGAKEAGRGVVAVKRLDTGEQSEATLADVASRLGAASRAAG